MTPLGWNLNTNKHTIPPRGFEEWDQGHLFQRNRNKYLKLNGTGNIEKQDFDFRYQGKMQIYFIGLREPARASLFQQ